MKRTIQSDQLITHPLESLPATLIVNGYSRKVKFNQNQRQARTPEDKYIAACQLKLSQGKKTGSRSLVTEGTGISSVGKAFRGTEVPLKQSPRQPEHQNQLD